MDKDAKNKWKELRGKEHGKEEVGWMDVARALSYTWENVVWLGRMTERRLLMAIARSHRTATRRQIKAIKSLVKSSFDLDDPGEIERAIECAAGTFDDNWEAKVDAEFVARLAALAVDAKSRKMNKVLGEENVTHDRVGQDPSHNDVGRDAN